MNIARKAAAFFLACLMLLLPVSAYAENGAALRASAFESVNTVSGLTLTTDQSVYSPYSLVLTVRFRNKTSRCYDYGAQYYLEKYVDGQWYTLERDVAYPAISYYLAAKGSTKHALTITDAAGDYSGYGQIEPGAYRIVQPMRDELTNETVYLAARFFVADISLYAKEPVNLRTGPSVNYGVIRELSWGERVSYIRKSGKWTLVRAGDQTGYVYGKYLVQSETDCYNDNSAMRLLRAAGVKNARASEVYANGSYIACDDRGIPYGCDRCVMVEWTKPYGGFLWMMIYADSASAQKKFAELASASESLRTDYSYFLSGRFILRRVSGTPIGLTQSGQVFYGKLLKALKQACDGYLGNEA